MHARSGILADGISQTPGMMRGWKGSGSEWKIVLLMIRVVHSFSAQKATILLMLSLLRLL